MELELAVSLQTASTLLGVLCYGGLIYVVLRHGLRGNRVNQLFSLYLLTMLLWQMAYFMVTVSATAESALFWYGVVVAVVSGQFIVYYLFANTLLRQQSPRLLVSLGLLVWAFQVIWVLRGQEPSFFTGVHRDGATGLFVPTFGPLLPILAGPNYFFLAYATFNLIRGYRSTKSHLQRSRIQYLLLGVALVVLGTVTNLVPSTQPYAVDVAANIINGLCIAYAIYRYQLLNIRLVLRKGLLYSIPSAIIGFAYFLVTFGAVGLFHLVAGYQLVLSLVIGALTAVAVEPLRSRVQSWVDRVFFREQYDYGLMLQDLSGTSASVLDQDQLTGMILDAVVGTMHIAGAAFLLKQEESGELRLVAQRGLDESADVRLRKDHPIVEWLTDRESILSRHKVDTVPQFKALWGQERADLDQIDADLFIPLTAKGELVGVFAVGAKLSGEAYSEADQLTLTTLANQTAAAIANARLYTAEQRRLNESHVLLDIASAVSSTLDLTQVLQLIARRTAEACQVHRCSIFLLDEEQQCILPLMSQYVSGTVDHGLWERFQGQTYVQRVDEVPILKAVIEDRQPLVLYSEQLGALPEAWVVPFDICVVLVVPLISRDRVIGAMALDQAEQGKRFRREQINLAMTIGSQTAAAIENARLHEQTMQEKARAEAILQETFSGMIVVDSELCVLSMNPGAELITGYRPHEVLGMRADEVLGASIVDPSSPLSRVRETGSAVPPMETVFAVRQGSKDVLLGATPLPAGGHPLQTFLLSFTDISKLKEIDRLKSSIVANVSHELRTPLASIKAYAELLLAGADGPDGKLREEWLAVIDQETDRVTALINDMLNLARLESERVELSKQSLNLGELITGVVEMVQLQAERRHIVITSDVEPDMPRLYADRGLMETVIKNLVDNAVKFSDDGGHVRVTAREVGTSLMFMVEDEGIGIPQDSIPQLFTKFYRVPSTDAAAVQGTGLGLALAREAVMAHGGRIEVESQLGEGSRFTVTVPQGGYLSLEMHDATAEQLGRAVVQRQQ